MAKETASIGESNKGDTLANNGKDGWTVPQDEARPPTISMAPPSRADSLSSSSRQVSGATTATLKADISSTVPLPVDSPHGARANGGVVGPPSGPFLTQNGIAIERATPTTGDLLLLSRRRRRALLRVGILLMSLLLVVELALLAPFTDPIAGQPVRKPSSVPLAEVDPYGVNTFLHKEVDKWKKDKTLEMARDLGVGWVRQQFPWAEIEYRVDPQRPYWDVKNNQNAWDKYDGIVDLTELYGQRLIARIDSAPVWSHPKQKNTLKAPPDAQHMADFGKFISTFVTRYKGRISAIQVWNEPNLVGEWATGRHAQASEYTELLKVAYTSAKAADPNVIVLAAPLATTNDTSNNLNEMDYLQGMYAAGAGQYFDAMSANAYGKDSPPEDPPSLQKLNFRRVELLRDVMVKNGDAGKAVWFNEYGWNSSPSSMSPQNLRWGRVSPEEQADYTVRGIRYARQNWPWAGVFTIWYLRQVGDIPSSDSEYYFGLVNPDFVVSPVYKAVQAVAQHNDAVAQPGQWGPLSPPVQPSPHWHLHLDAGVSGGVYIAPSTLGDILNIPFAGTDVQITIVPQGGGSTGGVDRYYVTVDGRSDLVAKELPRDSKGNAYIGATPAGATQVTLARGLGAEFRIGSHTLQIRADRENNPVAGGGGTYAPEAPSVRLPGIGPVTIEARRSYLLMGALTFLLLGGILFNAWALRRTRPRPGV
ncbi:MAG: hypothetical protein M3014_14150 [Chloroflexota bacterium]|nr:hypothetical protein [Chloroflexota bacterium]